MSDNSFTFNIAKLPTLTGQDNYRIWAASWHISFDAADYWEVVYREFAKPTPLTAAQKAKKAEEDDCHGSVLERVTRCTGANDSW